MLENHNPLMDFARKIECSVKLPTNGCWYDDDITFNSIGEVNIKPMLPVDEMMVVNPETLISGDAIIKVIESCCPDINGAKKLYYPDVNVLLLGIKKASYGDELKQSATCPKCYNVKTKLEENELIQLLKDKQDHKEQSGQDDYITAEEYTSLEEKAKEKIAPIIKEMEDNKKICLTPQEYTYSIDSIMSNMTFLPKDPYIELENGLKIYVSPYKCIDKIKISVKTIKNKNLYKSIITTNDGLEDGDEAKIKLLLDRVGNFYNEVSNDTIELLTNSIIKIKLPDGTFVENKEYIGQFLKNVTGKVIKQISDEVDKLNKCGIQDTLPMECGCCGHKWDEPFYGFNQSDFFGIGS